MMPEFISIITITSQISRYVEKIKIYVEKIIENGLVFVLYLCINNMKIFPFQYLYGTMFYSVSSSSFGYVCDESVYFDVAKFKQVCFKFRRYIKLSTISIDNIGYFVWIQRHSYAKLCPQSAGDAKLIEEVIS